MDMPEYKPRLHIINAAELKEKTKVGEQEGDKGDYLIMLPYGGLLIMPKSAFNCLFYMPEGGR
jgi:hypothetical protein